MCVFVDLSACVRLFMLVSLCRCVVVVTVVVVLFCMCPDISDLNHTLTHARCTYDCIRIRLHTHAGEEPVSKHEIKHGNLHISTY